MCYLNENWCKKSSICVGLHVGLWQFPLKKAQVDAVQSSEMQLQAKKAIKRAYEVYLKRDSKRQRITSSVMAEAESEPDADTEPEAEPKQVSFILSFRL